MTYYEKITNKGDLKVLLALLLFLFPCNGFCQVNIYGKWKSIKSFELITGDLEGKEELNKTCIGSIVNIGQHNIRFKPINTCFLSNVDSFNIKIIQKLNRKQVCDKFDNNVVNVLFARPDQNDIEMLITDFLVWDSGNEPLTIFIMNKRKIAIYSEPMLIIFEKMNY